MTPTPTVSVLMAVHNGEPYLRDAVNSILGQTLGDLELVVVDDASTDASRQIVESYGDPRIRVLVNEAQLGLTRSLNRGLSEVRGRYVARQDADDVSEPDRFALQVSHLEQHPELALLSSGYREIDDGGKYLRDRAVPLSTIAIRWQLLFANAFAHSSVIVRRSTVDDLGGYDEAFQYPQDYDLWSRIAACGEVAALPQPLVRYRRRAGSMTRVTKRGEGSDEAAAISRRNIERVLPGMAARLDREVAWRLLFGDAHRLDVGRATRVLGDVFALQTAFARYHLLEREEALAHRLSVAASVAAGLRRTTLGALMRRFARDGSIRA